MRGGKTTVLVAAAALVYVAALVGIVVSTDESLTRELGTGDVLNFQVTGKTGPPGPIGPPGPPSPGITGWPCTWNVCDYGAKGDGVTDSTPGFLRAISKAQKGDHLFIPKGRYVVTEEILVDKSLYISGQGLHTQIYQASDENLFRLFMSTNYVGCAGTRVQDMALGSAATTKGKSLLMFDHSPYNEVRNVAVSGGYYGVYIHGALGNQFYVLRTLFYPYFFKRMARSEAAVCGDVAYGKNVNHTLFYGTKIQGGAKRGIELHATNAEGGIGIYGGLIEGLPGESVYLTGFNVMSSISGLHCEAGNVAGDAGSNVRLAGCRNVSIEGNFHGGKKGLVLESCSRMDIRGGQTNGIYIDKSSKQIDVHGINYRSLHVHSKHTRMWNMQNMSDQGVGAYGYYSGPVADTINPNGMLEDWENGRPVGYGLKGGSVAQETEITHSLKSAARLTLSPNFSGLTLELPASVYMGKSLSIRFWVWIPKETKAKPRIALLYNNWYSCSFSPCFNEVEPEIWTPVSCTFYIPEKDIRRIQAWLGVIYCGTAQGDIIIDDISMGIFSF